MVQSGGGIGRRVPTIWDGDNSYRVGSNPTLTTKINRGTEKELGNKGGVKIGTNVSPLW